MDRQHIIIYSLIAALSACILYICSKPVTVATESGLLTDVVSSGILLSVLLYFLKDIINYRHFSNLSFRQKAINYSALGILFASCWIGLEYFVLFIAFPAEQWQMLYPLLPMRILIAFFIYLILILLHSIKNNTIEETEPEIEILQPEIERLNNIETRETFERIAVKNGQKIEVIPVHEIICIQAEGDYVMIHSQKGKFLKEQTMKSLEAGLPQDKFVRIHRSNIVNVDFIAQIELYDKQNQLLKLKNNLQVKVSQSGYKSLKKTLGL